jgi:uncharacterized membrane protein YdfJ with MMPL/SSD domain
MARVLGLSRPLRFGGWLDCLGVLTVVTGGVIGPMLWGVRSSVVHRLVVRLTRASVRHRRLALTGWLVFVVCCVLAGGLVGTRRLSLAEQASGSSARGLSTLLAAGLAKPASESVLIEGSDSSVVLGAASALVARLRGVRDAADVRGPGGHPALVTDGGREALVELQLLGDASKSVLGVQRAVAAVAGANRSVRLLEVGDGTTARAVGAGESRDFHRAELFAVPLTLIILALAFGAVVAACVPLLLGLTSVAAGLGAVGALSHLVPTSSQASSAILLIGLAVGVDYSLFYMRREREERRAGRDRLAALEVTTATVGHAVVVSGISVVVAMGGLLLTGSAVFTAVSLGTMLVVLAAVLGSVMVLPAMLAMLGDQIDRGRLWRHRRGASSDRTATWRSLANAVVSRPRLSLGGVVVVLVPLAFGVLQLHTSGAGRSDLPPGSPVLAVEHAIERTFPGGGNTAEIVIDAREASGTLRLSSEANRAALESLGMRAIRAIGAAGAPGLALSLDGRVAVVTVALPGTGSDARTIHALGVLRGRVLGSARAEFPGTQVDLTGAAAAADDFNSLMHSRAPIVIAFVLALGFGLLLLAFGSVALAAVVLALNLLSVGAAFGVLVDVFQHQWAQGVLGFTSIGAVVSWLPLFAFVVLFGLSMDYTVLVVARIHEGIRGGLSVRQAAADGVSATAGTVTSAAVVMVAVFCVFATLSALEFKELGVGLAVAILIDATLVRAVALPAAITLLAGRSWGRLRRPTGIPRSSITAPPRR